MPVTCIRQLLDPVTPLELQDEMIGRLPSPELVTVVELDTGHIPAVTHPEEMAAILEWRCVRAPSADRGNSGAGDHHRASSS